MKLPDLEYRPGQAAWARVMLARLRYEIAARDCRRQCRAGDWFPFDIERRLRAADRALTRAINEMERLP